MPEIGLGPMQQQQNTNSFSNLVYMKRGNSDEDKMELRLRDAHLGASAASAAPSV